MSDTPLSPDPAPDLPVAPEREVVVDLAAFLPEGSSFAAGDDADVEDLIAAEPELEPEAPKPPPVDLAALGRIETDLGAVDQALLALDEGRYGTCAACDLPIADELLAADPVRTTCEAHAPA